MEEWEWEMGFGRNKESEKEKQEKIVKTNEKLLESYIGEMGFKLCGAYNSIEKDFFHKGEKFSEYLLNKGNYYVRIKLNDEKFTEENLNLDEPSYSYVNLNILLPHNLKFLSSNIEFASLGREKPYYPATYGASVKFSSIETSELAGLAGLFVSMHTYTKEFGEFVNKNFDFDNRWERALSLYIAVNGLEETLEFLSMLKVALKEELQDIKYMNEKGDIVPADVSVVDEFDKYLKIKRNKYDIEWLEPYSESTIEALGGIDLIKQLISTKGEKDAKSILILANGIEEESRLNSGKDAKLILDSLYIDDEKEM